MSGYLLKSALLGALLCAGCGSLQYATVQKYVHDGQYSQAAWELTASGPADAYGWALLAECRYYLKDYRGQAEAARKSLDQSGEYRYRVVHYLRLAYTEQLKAALDALDTGSDPDAVRGFNEVLVFGNYFDDAMHPLVVKTNQRVSALAGPLSLRLRDHTHTQSFLAGLRNDWKDSPELMERLALIYLQVGEAEPCIEICESLLAEQPDKASVLQLRAKAASQTGKQDVELAAYRDAVEGMPDNKTLHRDLGSILYRMEDWSSARDHLQFALQSRDPDSLNLMLMVAECWYHQGGYNDALSYYERVVRSRPSDSDAMRGTGACLWAMGKKAEAEARFRQADRGGAGVAQRRIADSTRAGIELEGPLGGHRK
jgi:tetratricopeptide (TPR) repeat protein